MKRILFLYTLTFFSLSIYSQEESTRDTINSLLSRQPVKKWFSSELYDENYKRLQMPSENSSNIFDYNQPVKYNLNLPPVSVYLGPPLEAKETHIPFANDYEYSGVIRFSDGAWISGGSSHQTMLTYGAMRKVSAMYNRHLSRNLTVSAGTTINKYELYGRQYTTASLDAIVNYKLNERMNISAYGQYSIQRKDGNLGSVLGGLYPENPGQMSYGFTPTSQFGVNFNYQVTDWLYLSPGVYSARYDFFNNHLNDYGFNGKARIEVSDKVKFNLFGKYSLRGSQAEQYRNVNLFPQNSYGGSMEYWFSKTIGVEAGMIREINPFTGKWQNKPYVMPLINIK